MVSVFAWKVLRESRTDTQQFEAMHAKSGSSASALADVVRHPNLPASRLIWIYAIGIGAFYGTTPMLPLILAERLAVNDQNVGYFIMYLGGMGVIVRTGILGRLIERIGEPRVARLGLILLAAGLASVAMIRSYPTMLIALTLMPMGTAFVFPCTTAMLSRVVPVRERGLYMGVQHTFGGVSRVAFPLIAGYAMDVFGKGVPFVFAGVMVLASLSLTFSMESYNNKS
jgi:MFS family permease